ncbi:hypothetical protein [Pseudomonas syringae]|uniref:hypothetical protein n=1 Tax=Pseudomonas syringae TaxID=317 RepID=UPI00245AEB30|nr:hypothetical protein [Pseudomonas syringae]MDH4602354.1 hypothetical protein [Pseudomonas syringae pv. papulans]
MFKFLRTIDERESVYYQGPSGELVRFHRVTQQEFILSRCDQNGAPTEQLDNKGTELDRLPTDDSATSVSFRAWRNADQWLDEES